MKDTQKGTGLWAAPFYDFLLLAGLLILAYGCSLAYKPLGFIVAGAVLAVLAFVRGAALKSER